MNELITSPYTDSEFHKYFNNCINNFEKKISISNEPEREYEPQECSLHFMVKNFSCDYSIVFENNHFFFKLNFEINDNQYIDLRNEFYKKLNFLISDHRFFSRDENSIVLKSQIDEKLIESAHIIFATERWMKSYFFPETRDAMRSIVYDVFYEFNETMHQIWKMIYENFITYDIIKLLQPCESNSENSPNNENPWNLPPIIQINFNSYQRQKKEQIHSPQTTSKKKKNLVQKIYIFMKKLKTVK